MDSLTSTVDVIADAAKLVSGLFDGFNLDDIANLAELGQSFKAVLPQIPDIILKWENLDDASRSDLIRLIGEKVKFPPNVDIEEYLHKILDVLVEMSALYQIIKK